MPHRKLISWVQGLSLALATVLAQAAPPVEKTVILATTTSTQDSGLLDELIPVFQKQTGQGMGQTLAIAAEKKGHVLADRGTYLALRKKLGLAILHEGDPALRNVYHVIEVNGTRFPKVNTAGGRAFAEFMVSKAVQTRIKEFGIATYGSPLFFPDAEAR